MNSTDETWVFKHPLSADDEYRLRRAGKDVGALLPEEGCSVEENQTRLKRLATVLDSLLSIAILPEVSALQRTAVCNPLCAIIEACQASSNDAARNALWEQNVWSRGFAIFLERSDTSKAKSMRQILVLLGSVMAKELARGHGREIRDHAIDRIFEILIWRPSRIQAKPALQALDYFLRKKTILVEDLLEKYTQRLQLSPATAEISQNPERSLQHLLRRLLDWASNNDSSLAAGQLITTFVSIARQDAIALDKMDLDGPQKPLWAEPLEASIRNHYEQTQNYKNYVFPGLFKINTQDYFNFLSGLSLGKYFDRHSNKSHQAGDSAQPSEEDDPAVIEMLFWSLQSGKEMGIVREVDYRVCRTVCVHDKAVLIPDFAIGRLLGHISPTIRISAFSLLVSSPHITRPFTPGALRYIKRHFHHLTADTDANFRGEFLTLFQRLLDRLRFVAYTIERDLKRDAEMKPAAPSAQAARADLPEEEKDKVLKYHYSFIDWLLHSLVQDVRPTAPYQRRITSLKAISLALKSGIDSNAQNLAARLKNDVDWPRRWSLINPWLVRSMFDLLMDPFDDIRSMAAAILKYGVHLGQDSLGAIHEPGLGGAPQASSSDILPRFLERAERMMLLTGRADHADGVARTYELLCSSSSSGGRSDDPLVLGQMKLNRRLHTMQELIEKLDKTIDLARKDMGVAVSQHPMHGLLASMKYILEQPDQYPLLKKTSGEEILSWKTLHAKIFECLRMVWDCVKDVLCNDAPEGHMPEELEGEQDITTKDILSYSWRALKEASTLLRVIAANAPFNPDASQSIIRGQDLEELGKLCFIQLSELRHRGAFSTVAQTFAAICFRCTRIEDASIRQLPEALFEETMRCIQDKSTILTRRSGGIPALMVGIVAAAPDGPLFKRAMAELQAEGDKEVVNARMDGNRLPQVHALNCLKDIFTNSKLGEASEPYIGGCLNLAASKLESNVWWIRNCGLMLFRALIDRLLGYDDLQKSADNSAKLSRMSYEKYPGLLDILIGLLKPQERDTVFGASGIQTEGVFPALQILQRAPPPPSRQQEVGRLILELVRNKNWHVRVMAARTYAVIQDPIQALDEVKMVPDSDGQLYRPASQNELHGNLLVFKHSLPGYLQACKGAEDRLVPLVTACDIGIDAFFDSNSCPVTKAAFIDSMSILIKQLLGLQRQDGANGWTKDESIHKLVFKLKSSVETEFWKIAALVSEQDQVRIYPRVDFSLLRRSIAEFMANACVWFEFSPLREREMGFFKLHLSGFLKELSMAHPDSCKTVLETLKEALDQVGSKLPVSSAPYYIKLFYGLGCTVMNTQVRSTAFIILGELVSLSTPFASAELGKILLSDSPDRADFDEAPSLNEGVLKLAGAILDCRLQASKKWTHELAAQFEAFIRRIQCSLHEDCEFPRRYAAAQSLVALNHVWKRDPPVGLVLVTYDALNDDDDEIRELASRAATKIINGKHRQPIMTSDAVPLIASQKLAEHLVRRYATSEQHCSEALQRMLGGSLSNSVADFESQFAEARKINATLFVKEKQNLFIDDTREALVWSRVLGQLAPEAVSKEAADRLTRWVMEGLRSLSEAARNEFDGALGWTSKPEVFVLGMRVVFGAAVLMRWREQERKVSVRRSEIVEAMGEFVRVGREAGLHEMWLDSAERVLEDAVVRRLGKLSEGMRRVFGELAI